MRPIPRTLLALLALLMGAVSSTAGTSGGRFSVSPTLVVLSRETTSLLISVVNEGPSQVRFQLTASAWNQTATGEMSLAPTEDVVFFPQMLSLEPGESRNVRIATLAAPGGTERSYRLFIEELPESQAQSAPGLVQFLTRVSIPIFLAPGTAVSASDLRDLSRNRDALSFTLANTGNVHLRPGPVSVKALAHDGTVLGERNFDAWYVLAGGVRTFTTDLPGLSSEQAAEVVVEARVGGTVLVRRLDLATRVSR